VPGLKLAWVAAVLVAAYAFWTSAEAAVAPATQGSSPTMTHAAPSAAPGVLPHKLIAPAAAIRLAKSNNTAANSCKRRCKRQASGCMDIAVAM
jgi:hypothetical protein